MALQLVYYTADGVVISRESLPDAEWDALLRDCLEHETRVVAGRTLRLLELKSQRTAGDLVATVLVCDHGAATAASSPACGPCGGTP